MDLIARIDSSFGKLSNPSLTELIATLRRIPDLASHIQPFVTEPKEYPYGRNVIYRSDEVEVIVVNLPAQCRTFIHDHGKSIGCGQVLEGELTNSVFEPVERDCVRKTAENRVRAGQFFETPHGMIHQMVNMRPERVVSLHVYSPPLKGLKVYAQPEAAATVL